MAKTPSKGTRALLTTLKLSDPPLPEPELEYRFHPVRRWRLDAAWPDWRVAVEVHGGVHAGGRHTRGVGFERDREKMNAAILLDWKVLEYSIGQIERDPLAVITDIAEAMMIQSIHMMHAVGIEIN